MAAFYEEFRVGEKYKGAFNGIKFSIVKVIPPGNYKTPSGGLRILPWTEVEIYMSRGRVVTCPLEFLQNMQLERIKEAAE